MPKRNQVRVQIDAELMERLEYCKPTFLSGTQFLMLLATQALDQEGVPHPESEMPIILETQQPERDGFNCSSLEEQPYKDGGFSTDPISTAPLQLVEKKTPKKLEVPGQLLRHEAAIRDFWRVKKGSKGERAWNFLMGQLMELQTHYSDKTVEEQLEYACNAKWAGITVRNFEMFNKDAKRRKPPEPTEEELERRHIERLKSMGLA